MKIALSFFLFSAAIILIGQQAWAGQTVSQTFTIGVYLPPHVVEGTPAKASSQLVQDDTTKETTVETVHQGGQDIVLQTTVVK